MVVVFPAVRATAASAAAAAGAGVPAREAAGMTSELSWAERVFGCGIRDDTIRTSGGEKRERRRERGIGTACRVFFLFFFLIILTEAGQDRTGQGRTKTWTEIARKRISRRVLSSSSSSRRGGVSKARQQRHVGVSPWPLEGMYESLLSLSLSLPLFLIGQITAPQARQIENWFDTSPDWRAADGWQSRGR